MRAIVQDRYGSADVLELADIPEPALEPDGVLVRMHATSVDAGVHHLLTADIPVVRLAYGVRRPRRRPGIAFAGTVLAVGAEVDDLAIGQAVCGTSSGTFADVISARRGRVAAVPEGVDLVAASTVPISGVTALQAVRDHGRVSAGQRVLITGASGGVGVFAVQLAVAAGADVTAVCRASKATAVRGLGAQHVIDYTTEPITGSYDVVIDIAAPLPWGDTRRLLAPRGTLVIVGAAAHHGLSGGLGRNLMASITSPFVPESMGWFVQSENSADVATMGQRLADGSVRAVVDRVFPLEETVEAMRYYASGEAIGKIVITA